MSWLPQTVKVGYQVVSVEYITRLTDDEGRALCGSFSGPEMKISIDSMLQGPRLLDTFLHECLHAMFYLYGWSSTENHDEESVAHCLGFGLTMLLQDNPGLGLVFDDILKVNH
jgi:hypothetical protein